MASYLKHFGTPRHSGRYPWGSGKDNEQRGKSFLSYVSDLHKQGVSEVDIAKGLGISTTELRSRKTAAKIEQRSSDQAFALRLKEKGYSNVAIGKRMGINESSVRALLNDSLKEKADVLNNVSKLLKDRADEFKYIDVGLGVEVNLGISRTKLNAALTKLKNEEGYKIQYVKVKQQGTGKFTTIKVLTPPDVTYSEVFKNYDKIKLIRDYTENGGKNFYGLADPRNISSERVYIRYKEDGGADKDGVIELRRDVPELSLDNKKYAQVRIGVDGTHFMKGMAIYTDDIPDGVDVIYNTNKSKGTPKEKVFKSNVEDKDNPFGSIIRQKNYVDKDGKTQLSALNIVGDNEEGKWGTWSKTISSQVLSKQSPALAKKQLGISLDRKQAEFEEIMKLTNPSVKKNLLLSFADDCDSSSVHLKAAALPRQGNHVILPFPKMKENEIYAPNYDNGEVVVLIRHPHGGIFEIPELVVNNRNAEAKRILGNAIDAVGINPKVAAKLSGADFDGDTVLVIPNKNKDIRTSASLEGLKDFDPKSYQWDGPKMTPQNKQMQMGIVSNLITDMTIRGANQDEIARAVRHSMVVIDAIKPGTDRNLNYKQSAIDNNIADLKRKYQGGDKTGASTLISRASSEIRIPVRKDEYKIDPVTGKKVYQYLTNKYVIDEFGRKKRVTVSSQEEARNIGIATYTKTSKVVKDPLTGRKIYIPIKEKEIEKTSISTRMLETEDAFSLSSGTRMETIYAQYANSLKALANKARKTILETDDIPYSPTARKTYSKEVEVLNSKLNMALRNKPKERQAQLLANKIISAKRNANPDMTPEQLKRIKGQALEEARHRVGAEKVLIDITDREWEAIQAGAISSSKLYLILLNTKPEKIKERATPRTYTQVSASQTNRAKNMAANGYTTSEISEALGIPTNVLSKILE
jgi:transcriptional regulator with XRE-family HTH domain